MQKQEVVAGGRLSGYFLKQPHVVRKEINFHRTVHRRAFQKRFKHHCQTNVAIYGYVALYGAL